MKKILSLVLCLAMLAACSLAVAEGELSICSPNSDGLLSIIPLFEENAEGTRELGDIVLSLEKCRSQAAEFGHSFERECAFLTVHSTLHLLGYDHVNSEEEEKDMRERQTAIVEKMGLGVGKED